jgi:anthranilate phosphoribosyltransferase
VGGFQVGGGWPAVLGRLVAGEDLSASHARGVLAEVLAGEATQAQIGGLLTALRTKGESADEVAGMVTAMWDAAAPLALPDPDNTLDLVGTGGSPALREGAFNVSTIASVVAAAAGATVCKHGNRKASSTSGSTDLLEALDVEVELDGPGVVACVRDAGVGFAFARMFHPAMRHAAPVRAELGIPTVFNLLGPLSHPGHVGLQVIGVADPGRLELVAAAVARRGTVRSWVLHGQGGLDELTTTGPTSVIELVGNEEVGRFEVTPEQLGLQRVEVDAISVGDPAANAAAASALFEGVDGPLADMVALNTAAGLVVCGLAKDLGSGTEQARQALRDGSAAATLGRLVAASRAAAAAST